VLHEIDADGNRTGLKRTVPAETLPVDLPHLDDFKPHGRPEPPLEKADDSWLFVELEGRRYKRETNTMPQWAGSCWYFLRYLDPRNTASLVDPVFEKEWMPVDLYVGGAEHAVLHLLYSRFWHKVLYDRGHVSTPEPFRRLVNQGMILGELEYTAYSLESGTYVSAQLVRENEEGKPVGPQGELVTARKLGEADVEKVGDSFVLKGDSSIRVDSRSFKMSKSRGNVVNPDHIVRDYGADSLRLYEMFMGPLEATKPWSMQGVGGVRNFLDRVWRMIVDFKSEQTVLSAAVVDRPCDADQARMLHRTIRAVTEDTQSLGFNTAIARMMEFVNFFTRQEQRPREAMESFVLLLSPYAPHIAEELWHVLGHQQTLAYEPWPIWDAAALVESVLEIPVQVNGKLRAKIQVPADATQESMLQTALANDKVQAAIEGKEIVKTIVVPGRMVNLAVK
jgi:leucyl-tRNA synthetase